MVQKVKKLISMIFAVVVIMFGILILPPQGLAEDVEPENSLSATPVVKIDVNPSAGDIAGMFIGLENIIDSASGDTELQTYTIAGYRIEVTFDANKVLIPDVLDATNSGELFEKKIEITDGIGKVLVACASGGSIGNYDKLFFIPITLKGSAQDLTNISVKYLEVRETSLQIIQIPPLDNLNFQRGKIYNGELGTPNIADAVAGLQYLALRRNPGRGPQEVNVVNMASINESDVYSNIVKPTIEDIIALMQYIVDRRDDHFLPTDRVDFGAGTSNGDEIGVKRIELYDLRSGDQVEILRGSDDSDYIASFAVAEASPNPLVINNIIFGDELFLKVLVTRNGIVGIRYVYDNNLFIHMGAIAEDNTTSVSLNGLKTGDQVSLYQDNGSQIGSSQSVVDSNQALVFSSIALTEEGVKFRFNRPSLGSSTGQDYRRWKDMIAVQWRTDITEDGLENLTLQYLEDGDVVNLYDNNGNLVPDQLSQSPNNEGKVTFSNLELGTYQVEVERGNICSDRRRVDSPLPPVSVTAQ